MCIYYGVTNILYSILASFVMTTPQRHFCSICEESGDNCVCYQEINWTSVSQSETILTNSPTPVCGTCLKSTIECYCDKSPLGFGQHIMNTYSGNGDTCIQCGILTPSNQVCGWGRGWTATLEWYTPHHHLWR